MQPKPAKMPDIALHLARREIVNIHDGAGLLVRCVRGVLWITQADDSDDIVIEDGQCFVLDRPGLTLVSALDGPADMVIAHEPTAAERVRCAENRWPAARAA